MYETREDNLITEAPLIFGSGLRVRVSAKLRIPGTGYAVYFPVQVSNIQVRSAARRQLPCQAPPRAAAEHAAHPVVDSASGLCWQLFWCLPAACDICSSA